ncbi:MAG: PadR family transcriptional regulator [Candidatus Aminicenantes bacterium]|nr:PadR family transcriptional regulator [Candidatus Aminicenantes bacterium]
MSKNRTQYAILGMLSLEPMSGYDFRKAAEQCLGFFWQESYGQIYPTLKRLLEKGHVTASARKDGGKPDKHVFTITKKGREAFRKWLDQETGVETKRNELLLKLFFGGKTSLDGQIRELESLKANNVKILAELASIEDWHWKHYDHHALTPYWLMTIRFGVHRIKALAAWCDESIDLLKKSRTQTFSNIPRPMSLYFKTRKP